MSNQPQRSLRLTGFDQTSLNTTVGKRGEIFWDQTSNTLRIFTAQTAGGVSLARADLNNVTSQAFAAKALASGVGQGQGQVQSGQAGRLAWYSATGVSVDDLAALSWNSETTLFSIAGSINVSGSVTSQGQKNFMRFHWDTLQDLNNEAPPGPWHGMVAHVHSTGKLYYAHAAQWVPVASADEIPNAFNTVAVQGHTAVIAETTESTLTLQAGSGIEITTDPSTDTVVFTALANTGNVIFEDSVIATDDSSTIVFESSVNFLNTVLVSEINSDDSSAITVMPSVVFLSDISVGTDILFPDGSRLTSAQGFEGPQGPVGPQGPAGATGAGTGDVISSGGGYTDNAVIRYDGVTGTIIQTSSVTISDLGVVTATGFSGSGQAITDLNASNLSSGTVPDARFPATLPSLSGANLTGLNASNLSSGTVPDARFPATLPSLSGANLTGLNASNLSSGTVGIARLGSSGTPSASTYLRGDNTWATVTGGAASNSFETIAVAGQSSVVADSGSDILTLVAGTGITITTDNTTDSVTIAASVSNTFTTIQVTGQSSVVADSSTDTLILTAGSGIQITTDPNTDTITITNNAAAPTFNSLSDASTAGITVDEIYIPAITVLDVTNSGSTAYRFDQYGSTNNPTVFALNGATIAFKLSVAGHPFLIQTSGGSNYDTGLIHVSTSGTVTTGSSAQGQTSGTLYWKIPSTISGNYRYQCSIHGGMQGTITVKDFSAI